jgi:hypothetical protein
MTVEQTDLRELVVQLKNRLEAQETEIASLREQVAAQNTPTEVKPPAISSQSRRKMLKGLAAGVAGIGAFGVGAVVGGTVVAQTGDNSAIEGENATGYGGKFSGGLAPLRLVPSGSANAPTSGTHQAGELYVDNAGKLFFCTVAGTPGTWVNLSSGGGTNLPPNINLLPNAVRVAATIAPFTATKLTATGATPKIGDSSTVQISIGGTNTIPANAKGVVGVLTNVAATAGGNLRFWTGGTAPNVSNLNVPGALPSLNLTASFAIPLDSAGKVYLGYGTGAVGAQCGYVVDISGYWL